jgi:hypothetical protein
MSISYDSHDGPQVGGPAQKLKGWQVGLVNQMRSRFDSGNNLQHDLLMKLPNALHIKWCTYLTTSNSIVPK